MHKTGQNKHGTMCHCSHDVSFAHCQRSSGVVRTRHVVGYLEIGKPDMRATTAGPGMVCTGNLVDACPIALPAPESIPSTAFKPLNDVRSLQSSSLGDLDAGPHVGQRLHGCKRTHYPVSACSRLTNRWCLQFNVFFRR
jgi:hypothetical protein